jgi:histidinol-phosphate/aromatic aminotransferase/cobyric acid decarboxylase-like protein
MVGSLTTTPKVIAGTRGGDPRELRSRLAQKLKVDAARVFLTTGATEANLDALVFLYREATRRTGRVPRYRTPVPDYPPLAEMPKVLGFRSVGPRETADLVVCSQPNNPTGTLASTEEFEAITRGSASVLVDETFREFTAAPSLAGEGRRGLWVSGTFTKVYGADALRVGYLVPPPEEVVRCRHFADYALHDLADTSVAGALAVLDHRNEILRESRGLFRENFAALRARVRGVPRLAAPVWFDRGDGVLPGDTLARRALDSGVLVCSGSFFGDATGVRVTLTRRTFPEDLDAYVAVRDRFL